MKLSAPSCHCQLPDVCPTGEGHRKEAVVYTSSQVRFGLFFFIEDLITWWVLTGVYVVGFIASLLVIENDKE